VEKNVGNSQPRNKCNMDPQKDKFVRLLNTREGLETSGANQEVYLNLSWGRNRHNPFSWLDIFDLKIFLKL
jgi:hypothetical protein